jgi:carbamoyl-phosphate synthase large subunit
MPLDRSLDKVMMIGSGPIVIGQAAEFDFSGSQAAMAVAEEGIETVVVNSNPATIQTDQRMADEVYLEPLEVDVIEKIIEKENPDGILSGMGGQTALNLCSELAEEGVLDRTDTELLGTPLDAINRSEDRELFKETMKDIGEPVTEAYTAESIDRSIEIAEDLGYPVLVRPAYTLGGTGGGVAEDRDELVDIAARGIQASRIDQVLLERSLEGWQEYEYEVMRDAEDNTITVCNMENIDPMGLHTGESAVVAPSQTLSDEDYQRLRSSAIKCIRALDIRGGCNIQHAINPETREYVVIEVNPRVSRSSALASKATGYPIARVAAKIACGYTLDEIPNAITQKTPASFEPALDYVVTKIPRWPFDKFPHIDRSMSTQMKSTGEAMGIGRTFEQSFLKALRSLEQGHHALKWPDATEDELDEALEKPTDQRLIALGETFRRGASVKRMRDVTQVHPWYLMKLKRIVDLLEDAGDAPFDDELLREAKINGATDADLAERWDAEPHEVREARLEDGVDRTYKMVDTCAAEFEARTPYYYGSFESVDEVDHEPPEDGPADSVVVVGAGPIRIGQGIEFDYCCVHAAQAIEEADQDVVMVNNNPETVSTDFDTSDRLYFEPLTLEDVLGVVRREDAQGVMLQFGGQTSVNLAVPLARELEREGLDAQIMGTSPEAMDICEDRERFTEILDELHITYPAAGTAASLEEALDIAADIGYPVLVRPSYVLGGRAMQVVYSDEELEEYVDEAAQVSPEHELLIDNFLDQAIEIDVDAVSDGENVVIGGIMEHVEQAGVHSGDSTCILPPQSLTPEVEDTIRLYTRKLARRVDVQGLLNIQYAVKDNEVYILEANPRASRTVPFVSKASGVPLAKLAARVMLGEPLDEMDVPMDPEPPRVACKAPVFPFLKLPGLDTILGPEMKSTGEVMGIGEDAGTAYEKAMTAAWGEALPEQGTVYITVRDEDKPKVLPIARTLVDAGFDVVATKGTAEHLRDFDVPCKTVWRISEQQSPDALDLMRKGEIDLIINTPTSTEGARADAYNMRRLAVELDIPFLTTVRAARHAARAIGDDDQEWDVASLRDLHGHQGPPLGREKQGVQAYDLEP